MIFELKAVRTYIIGRFHSLVERSVKYAHLTLGINFDRLQFHQVGGLCNGAMSKQS